MNRLLSSSEREYIKQGVEQDLRADGRKRLDFRPFNLDVDIVPQAAGSARIRLGRTDILVSIKTDIGRPDISSPSSGNILCSVDAASGSAASAAAGSGMGAVDAEDRNRNDRLAELSTTLSCILKESGGVDLTELAIVPGKHCWHVYVDVLILDEDGNLMDAIMLATRAALARTKLPGVSIEEGSEQTEIVLSDDPGKAKSISFDSIPITVTFCQIGRTFVADASVPEEVCSEASLVMAVNKSGSMLYTKKQQAGHIDPSRLMDMVHTGQKLASSIIDCLDSELGKSMQQ